ncbi:MAG TPA: hypothetical protein VE011_02625 [Candidatus Dormibacteraeota bacterium]|nr:hypothetical protein [Candidatus Dormibacteraeota bacterium]
MIRFVHRSGAALLAALLLGAVIVPASTLAKVPGWAMQVVATPADSPCASGIGFCATVSPSAAVRFVVTIKNNGKSNIAQLYLTSTIATAPLSVAPSTGCNASGQLLCSLGALNAGASVTRTIIYRMPAAAGTLDFQFEANTTGVSASDGGTSHGDSLRMAGHVVLDGSADYTGGFLLDTSNLVTGGAGGQSTTLTPPASNIGVTIREVSGTDNPCNAGTPIGQLVLLNVSNGTVYATPFKTVLTIATSGLPGEQEISTVKLCHKYDNGTASFLPRCATDVAPTNGIACFYPKFGGTAHPDQEPHGIADTDDWSQLIIDIWDFQNGSIRGGF